MGKFRYFEQHMGMYIYHKIDFALNVWVRNMYAEQEISTSAISSLITRPERPPRLDD